MCGCVLGGRGGLRARTDKLHASVLQDVPVSLVEALHLSRLMQASRQAWQIGEL